VARARDNLTYVMVVLYLTQTVTHAMLYNTQFFHKSGRRSAAKINLFTHRPRNKVHLYKNDGHSNVNLMTHHLTLGMISKHLHEQCIKLNQSVCSSLSFASAELSLPAEPSHRVPATE